MRFLVSFFFFVTFFVGFSRALLEICIKPRNMLLLKFSAAIMGISVFFFFLMIYQEGRGYTALPGVVIALLFLTGAFLCAWMGYAWLRSQE